MSTEEYLYVLKCFRASSESGSAALSAVYGIQFHRARRVAQELTHCVRPSQAAFYLAERQSFSKSIQCIMSLTLQRCPAISSEET